MAEVSSDASFAFIAHMAEWGLDFPIDGNGWSGALPTAIPTEGSTVWGAVYSVPDGDAGSIDEVEAAEGRTATTVEVIDRMGKRHSVVTHLANGTNGGSGDPSIDYVTIMLAGSRHWSLPAGWIAGLEEHIDAEW